MTQPAKPENEEERLAELHRYRILDTDPEQAYDDLVTIVAGICGTPMGDETLAAIGRTINAQRGPHGFAARLGGEEFALLMTDLDELAAELQCEYIREAVQNLPVNIPATVSIGIAAYQPGDDAMILCMRADEALYAAKRGGRNRVVIADENTAAMPKRAVPR